MLVDDILKFLGNLVVPEDLPGDVHVLNPYAGSMAWSLCSEFYRKFYSDDSKRFLILGINPGRFGGGTTGIPFTDPLKLEEVCGIPNTLPKKAELSSNFIYELIRAYGGPDQFYKRYYFSSVCPLGFTRNGKNMNYYDSKELTMKVIPFILSSIRVQLQYGLYRDICFCLGEGDNFKFLSQLNSEHHFFERIIPLAHPRFILQYRRKLVTFYVQDYLSKFAQAEGHPPIFGE